MGVKVLSRPKSARTAAVSKPPIWCTESPSAWAWVTRAATACPVSYSAQGCGPPSSAAVRAATRTSALAAPAQAWLPGPRAAKSRPWASSPRRVTRNRHGWLFWDDGAQRAASSKAVSALSPSTCSRSNPRGLHRSASSG